MRQLVALLVLGIALVGCSTAPPVRERPAPIVRKPAPPPPPPSAKVQPLRPPAPRAPPVQIQPYRPARPPVVTPVYGPAVGSLVRVAAAQRDAGHVAGASASLERALRIEPRNPYLWNQLAHLRVQQRRLGEAADLAEKSNALAGPDRTLRRDNWLVIAKARYAAGDLAGAQAAQLKAESLR